MAFSLPIRRAGRHGRVSTRRNGKRSSKDNSISETDCIHLYTMGSGRLLSRISMAFSTRRVGEREGSMKLERSGVIPGSERKVSRLIDSNCARRAYIRWDCKYDAQRTLVVSRSCKIGKRLATTIRRSYRLMYGKTYSSPTWSSRKSICKQVIWYIGFQEAAVTAGGVGTKEVAK